jgi:hypothetical protein
MFEVPHCAITAVQLTKHELSLETRQEKSTWRQRIVSSVNFHFLTTFCRTYFNGKSHVIITIKVEGALNLKRFANQQ